MSDQPDWAALEERVRELATSIWDRPAVAETIAGVRLDCVLKVDPSFWVVVEISKSDTLEKLRTDLAKLAVVRPALMAKGIALRCYFVCDVDAHPSLRDSGDANNVEVMSVAQFGTQFLDYQTYKNQRLKLPFGSAVDPDTGHSDSSAYVPVHYRRGQDEIQIDDIAGMVATGKKVVLIGEFGTGKSRAVKELFTKLASFAADMYRYPIAINLREQWGLRRGTEIIRRHFEDLGLSRAADSVIKVYQRQGIMFLLDGFDEIGSQSWSDDPKRLVGIREQSVQGVKDLIAQTNGGVLIAGRAHYFNGEDEMLRSLGLDRKTCEVVYCHNEFTVDEMNAYLGARSKSLNLPAWLPRRPLICQTIAKLSDSELDQLSHSEGDANFCVSLIDTVCKREARISPILDAVRIKEILQVLARNTRSKPHNTGPLSVTEINRAFESVVGVHPVDESAVMLQRLPTLGRLSAESSDREFVDTFLLDGLRALDVIESVRAAAETIAGELWLNPLEELGQSIVATSVDNATSQHSVNEVLKPYLRMLRVAGARRNKVLAADIISSLLLCDSIGETLSFGSLELSEASFSRLDLSNVRPSHLTISDSTLKTLVLSPVAPEGVQIVRSLIAEVQRVSSTSGLPPWMDGCEVASYQSLSTVDQIKGAGLGPAHTILVTVVKKTFLQKGNGRKEEALLRGLGAIADAKTADRIVKLLVTEKILNRIAGDEGSVYVPIRAQTQRMRTMLAELVLSKDPLWLAVAKMDKN